MCTRQRRRDHCRRRLAAEVVLTVLIAAIPLRAMAQSLDADDVPTAVVRVDTVVDVSAENLRVAEGRAASVFGRVGVRLRWVDEGAVIREQLKPSFTIALVTSMVHSESPVLIGDVLGFAFPQGRRAYVFYDRVEALSERSQRSAASLLGDAMTHELGHLLLPTPGHSADGIMRRDVDITSSALRTFTRAQGRAIVTRLRQARLTQARL